MFLILFVLILQYFVGVGIIYGFNIAAHPEYNITTGCPYSDPECKTHTKMMCYDGNIASCFALGIPTMLLVMLLSIIVILFGCGIWYLLVFLFNLFKDFHHAKTQIIDATGKSHQNNVQENILNDSDTIIDLKSNTSSDSNN